MSHFPALFSPGKIGGMLVKNRIVMAPMATNFAACNGEATETLIDYYRERAKGGAGLIIVEAACVDSPAGREGLNQLCIDDAAYIPGLQRLAEEIKIHGCRAFIQLFHAGRQTSSELTGGQPIVAPSALACPMMKEIPHALEEDEIRLLRDKFLQAAVYACRAGFDGIELHAAHGYLINQFLSSHSNQREDRYGGSLTNRMRFLLEIVIAIKSALPGFPLAVRLNIDDFITGGLSVEESLEICRQLEAAGVDLIHCSCGTYESGLKSIEPSSYPEGWRMYLAGAVKNAVQLPVIGGGIIRKPAAANQVITSGQADFVFLGRPLLADPYWPQKAMHGQVEDIRPCISCNRCISNNFNGLSVRCTVNPYTGRERYQSLTTPKENELKAVVIGGGPAGIQAALSLYQKGIKVKLYEKEGKLGGFMNLAGLPIYKERILLWRDYLCQAIEKSSVEVILNKTFDYRELADECPDILVVATGSASFEPDLPISHEANCHNVIEILKQGKVLSGQRITIIGGGSIGCELADMLAAKNNLVTIVEKDSILAREMEKKNRRDLLNRLDKAGVERKMSAEVKEIQTDQVIILNAAGLEEEIISDHVLWATGFKPNPAIYYEALGKIPWVFLIGDAREVRGFAEAVAEGEAVGSLFA